MKNPERRKRESAGRQIVQKKRRFEKKCNELLTKHNYV